VQTVDYRIFRLNKGEVVLDLGCGEGRHVISTYVEGDVHSVGVDLCVDDLKTTVEKFEPFHEPGSDSHSFGVAAANALHLPFADDTFDKVVCSEVLEHIPDYRGALEEIQRVVKTGGMVAISVPRAVPEKICWMLSHEYHSNEGGHLRIFNAGALRQDVESFGLQYICRHWAHALHAPFWWLKCLFWESQERNPLVSAYHRFLVWDMMDSPRFTRVLERICNPLFGKSVVMYFYKPAEKR
jgi:SAM-dependent methyltransferase